MVRDDEGLVARSGDVDTGARTIEHLLEGTIHPLLSAELVARLGSGTTGGALHLDVSAEGRFTVRLEVPAAL